MRSPTKVPEFPMRDFIPDVLTEEQLWERLNDWETKRAYAVKPEEISECDKKMNLYCARLYRIGAI